MGADVPCIIILLVHCIMGRKVQFVLRSPDIYANQLVYTNNAPPEDGADYYNPNNGSQINRWHTNMTWRNVSLYNALRPIFDANKSYRLKLENIAFCLTSNISNYSPIENDRSFNIFLSMTPNPFLQTYSTGNGKRDEVLLTSLRLPNGSQSYVYNFSNRDFSFASGLDSIGAVDINIQYRDLLTNINEPSANLTVGYPHAQFTFSIEEQD